MGKPSLHIDDLRPDQVRRVPITRETSGWQLPDGTVLGATFRARTTLLSVPDWGFTTVSDGPPQADAGPSTFTTSFARQAGTLVATAPIPDPADEAACAARLVGDLHGAFGPQAKACRAELAALLKTLVARLLGPRAAAEGETLFRAEMPSAPSKPGRLLHPAIPPTGFPIPGKILLALAGTARSVRNGQAKPLTEVWLRSPATAHDRLAAEAEADLRIRAAEARTRLDLRGWLAAQPVLCR